MASPSNSDIANDSDKESIGKDSQDKDGFNVQFVQWFRDASPYIHQHRGKSFVIAFGGEAIEAPEFEQIIQDIALLKSLGIRLVIVHGVRPQIDKRIDSLNGEKPKFHLGKRVTTLAVLQSVIEAAGATRMMIEAALSMGLANSPMHGAGIRVHSGNLITAKPLGIIDGVDFNHTGMVRKVDQISIAQQLATGNIVLLSPLGYSPTGEVFNLNYEEVASEVACAINADKLIYLTEQEGILNQGQVVREITTGFPEVCERPENAGLRSIYQAATCACKSGVNRIHLLGFTRIGAMLLELFTRDGIGTMLTQDEYEVIRHAEIDDVAGIITLIRPLEEQGVLVRRSRERLEQEIQQFTVIVRDGTIVGAAALFPVNHETVGADKPSGDTKKYAELGCLVVHEAYQSRLNGKKLLDSIELRAKGLGINRLFVLTTQTAHWFVERGFIEQAVDSLPFERQQTYNFQRLSKVFVKSI